MAARATSGSAFRGWTPIRCSTPWSTETIPRPASWTLSSTATTARVRATFATPRSWRPSFGPRPEKRSASSTSRRGSNASAATSARRCWCAGSSRSIGQPRVTVRLRPNFDYGATVPQTSIGSNHARFIGPESVLRVTSDLGPSYILNESPFLLVRPISLFIGSDESLGQDPDGLAKQFIHETTGYWLDWIRALAIPFEWQDAVIRAAITLKLCSYEETGAVLAALTTSIPEAPNTGRNWDYRFCWLRDAYFTVNALNRLGATRTMEHFVRFLLDAAAGEDGAATCARSIQSSSASDTDRTSEARRPGRGFATWGRCGSAMRRPPSSRTIRSAR